MNFTQQKAVDKMVSKFNAKKICSHLECQTFCAESGLSIVQFGFHFWHLHRHGNLLLCLGGSANLPKSKTFEFQSDISEMWIFTGLRIFPSLPLQHRPPFFVVNETWWAGLFGFKCQSEGRGFRQAWGWGKGRERLGFQWCQKWVGQKWPRILREIFEVSQARPVLCAYHFISLCWGLLKRSLLTRPANCVCPSWSRRWKRNWMPQMWSLHSSCRWKRWDVELIGELMGCGKGHVHCTKIGRSSPLMSWGLFSYLSVPATIWAGFKEQRVSMFCIWSLCGQCIRMFGC